MRATYKNAITGQTYSLAVESDGTAKLAQAWSAVRSVAQLTGWNRFDIRVLSVA